MQQNGIVDERARAAFEKVRAQAPDAIEPKVWLAIAKEQDGDLTGAASEYRTLTAAAGDQEPWKSLLAERSKSLAAKLAGAQPGGANKEATAPSEPGAAPGSQSAPPGAMSPGAASPETMAPAQQQAFIEQMVSGLAARLQSNGKDLDGWMRLVRAYTVLGRPQRRNDRARQRPQQLRRRSQGARAIAGTGADVGHRFMMQVIGNGNDA